MPYAGCVTGCRLDLAGLEHLGNETRPGQTKQTETKDESKAPSTARALGRVLDWTYLTGLSSMSPEGTN